MENLAHKSPVWMHLGRPYNYVESFNNPRLFRMKTLFLILLICATPLAFGQGKKVAVVKIVRGDVDVLSLGKTLKLKVDDWVEDGSVVKTADKSFAKLIFIDKSQMNIGPNSEMKIEKFSGNDSGVIDLVKGKIRSQVTKDYLQMNKDKSKLFIKTPNAVMGIRGTDFMISTNGKTTSAILFEGSVVFNKMESRGITNSDRLEDMVDRGVRMNPGEFSVVDQTRPEPTVPSVLNVQQREALEKNETFDKRAPSNSASVEASKSVVPVGLTGDTVSNDESSINKEVAAGDSASKEDSSKASDANGYAKGDAVKPANGSIIHVESGTIIAPGADSALDANTNSYGVSPDIGTIADDGSFVPAGGGQMTDDGNIIISVKGADGKPEIVVKAPPPSIKPEGPAVVKGPDAPTGPKPASGPAPVEIPVMIPKPPTGGIQNVNDAVQQFNNGPKLRTININN
jgi:hypothetical protein